MNIDYGNSVSIDSDTDIVAVRKTVRDVATAFGFGATDVTRIVTAASELARNIYRFAGSGVMQVGALNTAPTRGISITFVDQGPGIADVNQAMEEGYTTCQGLGLGLPGTKRLMDEMEIHSELGKGTKVTVRKWLKK